MPHASNEESSRQLTDNEAHDVLARAAALDARLADTVSYDALWSSAEAAGISRVSFEQAAAELRAGKLGRRRTNKVLTTALRRAGQLAIAAALIWFAFRTPDYSLWWIAQSFGTAFALYGAFQAVGVVGRWFGRGGPQHRTHSPPHDASDTSTSRHVTFAVRVQATTAARPVIA